MCQTGDYWNVSVETVVVSLVLFIVILCDRASGNSAPVNENHICVHKNTLTFSYDLKAFFNYVRVFSFSINRIWSKMKRHDDSRSGKKARQNMRWSRMGSGIIFVVFIIKNLFTEPAFLKTNDSYIERI